MVLEESDWILTWPLNLLRKALEKAGGNQTRAVMLGITLDTLRYKMKKFDCTDPLLLLSSTFCLLRSVSCLLPPHLHRAPICDYTDSSPGPLERVGFLF
jgi:hypothetical protein